MGLTDRNHNNASFTMKMLRCLLPLLLVSVTCTSAFALSSLFSSADNAEEVETFDEETGGADGNGGTERDWESEAIEDEEEELELETKALQAQEEDDDEEDEDEDENEDY